MAQSAEGLRERMPQNHSTATSSTPTPVMDHDGDYTYQDNRDTQQVADDSIAFLRTFSLRLQRFRAQVGKFAYVDQPSSHTDDMVISDDGPIKKMTTTVDGTKPNEPLPADERDSSLDEQQVYTPKLCGQCESSRAELSGAATQLLTAQTDRTPPCPDDMPDHPFPEDTYVTTRACNQPPPLQGIYVAKYSNIPWAYATIKPERDNPRPSDPPMIDDGDDDGTNDGINPTVNKQSAPYETENTGTTYKKTLQPTEDTQKTAHIVQEIPITIHEATPPGRPEMGFATPSKEQTRHTTNLWTYSTDITQNYGAKPHGHRRTSIHTPTAKEMNKTTHSLIETEGATEREIKGLVPDRGKKSRYETRKVNLIYMPT